MVIALIPLQVKRLTLKQARTGNLYDEVALTGTGTPEQQEGFLQNVLGRAGQTVDNALNELGKVPGAVADLQMKP